MLSARNTPSAESVGRSKTDRQPDYRRSGTSAQTHYNGFGHEFDDHCRDIVTIGVLHYCGCCAITDEHGLLQSSSVERSRGEIASVRTSTRHYNYGY